ncbi:MAG: hypothetical protein IPM51_07350 [Sphingobacteriaceae bacterium]|nr:hypothetical protein [Sphingobacteriaceae bacterium]
MRVALIFNFILLLVTTSNSQKLHKSRFEYGWAFMHPYAAIHVKKIYKNTIMIYKGPENKLVLDSLESGGKLDAYRHVLFMAAFSQKIKAKKIRKLGIAHEKGNKHMHYKKKMEHGFLPDSIDTVMDLHNNELGIRIGSENKSLNYTELSNKVIKSLLEGEGIVTKRNNQGKFTDCNGEVLEQEELVQWNNKKCLIRSNE